MMVMVAVVVSVLLWHNRWPSVQNDRAMIYLRLRCPEAGNPFDTAGGRW